MASGGEEELEAACGGEEPAEKREDEGEGGLSTLGQEKGCKESDEREGQQKEVGEERVLELRQPVANGVWEGLDDDLEREDLGERRIERVRRGRGRRGASGEGQGDSDEAVGSARGGAPLWRGRRAGRSGWRRRPRIGVARRRGRREWRACMGQGECLCH